MKAELKAKWIEALRSGNYQQASGVMLNLQGAMCCLGVLGHIQGAKKEQLEDLGTNTLPRGFNAGLSMEQRELLASMNDGTYSHAAKKELPKHTFTQIADFIETNIPGEP